MINLEAIVTDFENLVRLRQTVDPDLPQLTDDIVLPDTARLVDHPLINTANLEAISPDYDNMNFNAWVSETSYSQGKKARGSDGAVYESLINANQANDPVSVPSAWKIRPLLSEWLVEKRKESIRTSVMDVYTQKKAEAAAREQLSELILYSGAGYHSDKIVKRNRLVGYEIEVLNNNGLFIALNKIGTQFDTAQTVNFYLFHSDQEDPLEVIPIQITKMVSVEWSELAKTLKYRNTSQGIVGGFYYLMYDEEEITGQAINKRFTFGSRPCASCNRYNTAAYEKYSQYFRIKAVSIGYSDKNGVLGSPKMWDLRKTQQNFDTNWGLNLEVNSGCDLTDYLIKRADIFSDLIAKQMKVDLLNEIANSTTSNVLSEKIRNEARFALQDTDTGGQGYMQELKLAKKAVSIEIASIERNVCMPRAEKRQVQSSSISTGGWRR